MANLKTLKPFKDGYDERRNYQGRPKGSRNFKILFEMAIEKIALKKEFKNLDLELEIVKRGIIEALKGNYSFWKDIMDRIYGKPKEQVEFKKELEMEKLIEIERKMARALNEGEKRYKLKNQHLQDG